MMLWPMRIPFRDGIFGNARASYAQLIIFYSLRIKYNRWRRLMLCDEPRMLLNARGMARQ